MTTDTPTSDDEPSGEQILEAAHQHMVEAVQDYTRMLNTMAPHPLYEEEGVDDPSVLVGWVLVFDTAHADGTRSLRTDESEGLQEWQALGMLEYGKQLVQAQTTIDAIEMQSVLMDDDEDDDDGE